MKWTESNVVLERCRTLQSKLEGRRETLSNRHQELTRSVALAKARAIARLDVDPVLEAVQSDENAQTLDAYAGLLSAVCGDVLGPDIEIGLNLTTERGLPALDIVSKRDGNELDIFESESGALTNVVCTALRAIATSSSNLRQFLLFDEPDCWTEPTNAPAFFNVLADMSRRTGIQTVLITHRRLTGLGTDLNVIELVGTAETGLQAVVQPGAPEWKDHDTVGLRSIRLRNFASFEDCTIALSPGINVIIGANRIGKSRLTRAMRSVAYGASDSSDEDIRNRMGTAEVDIVIEGQRTLSWSRCSKRNPVTKWRLCEADGTIAVVGPQGWRCEEGGRSVPEWVSSPLTLGLAKVDGLDIQIAHQKIPVFLLSSEVSAAQRAKVLSVGGESGLLREMIAMGKRERNEDSNTVRNGEKEIASLRPQIAGLESLESIGLAIKSASEIHARIMQQEDLLAQAQTACIRMDNVHDALLASIGVVQGTRNLPLEPDLSSRLVELDNAQQAGKQLLAVQVSLARARKIIQATETLSSIVPQLIPSDAALECARHLEQVDKSLKRTLVVLRALDNLVPAMEVPLPTDDMEVKAGQMISIQSRLQTSRNNVQVAEKGEITMALEISDMLEKLGNLCPLCGSAGIDHHKILDAESMT